MCLYSTKYFFSTPLPVIDNILISFPCLCHRLIQFLLDPPFLYLLFAYVFVLTLCVSHLFCFVYCSLFYYWGSPCTSIYLLIWCTHMLTLLSCIKIWIEKKKYILGYPAEATGFNIGGINLATLS